MWIKFRYILNKKKSFWFVIFSMFDISSWVLLSFELVDTWHFSKSTITWSTSYLKEYEAPLHPKQSPTKFNGHWRCETGDVHFYDTWLNGCSQLDLSHILLKLVAIVLAKVEIKLFKKSRDNMINESGDSVDQTPSS